METKNGASLYERLGGANGISNIVDDIVELHSNNPAISPRFVHMMEDPERMEKIKKYNRQFFGAGSGGPETYEGMDMPTAHKGMNVSESEYSHVVDDIVKALSKNNVDATSQNEVLGILHSIKEQIVRV